MGKFDTYKLPLKNMEDGIHHFEYALDNTFFLNIDGDEVHKGKVNMSLTVKRHEKRFDLSFSFAGTVQVPCDRCLDNMEVEIEGSESLIVKLGETYSEEGDNTVIIPESEGEINLAWFLYEFVALSIPMKHVHAPGKCNKTMTSKLRKHLTKSSEDEDSDEMPIDLDDEIEIENEIENETTDPRWDELKKIIDNN